eukprot:9249196-Alexandrium_andersonii.AAC.1
MRRRPSKGAPRTTGWAVTCGLRSGSPKSARWAAEVRPHSWVFAAFVGSPLASSKRRHISRASRRCPRVAVKPVRSSR